MKAKFNSQDTKYRNPFGAIPLGTTIQFAVEIESNQQNYCMMRYRTSLNPERERLIPMEIRKKGDGFVQYGCSLIAPMDPCLIWYDFAIRSGEAYWYISNQEDGLGGEGLLTKDPFQPFQITVYRQRSHRTDWLAEGIMYQIFVDRFHKGSTKGHYSRPALIHSDWYDSPYYVKDEEGRILRYDFFGGTLSGITEKLPYLHDLGVTILYLNPIFESASNHKYDTADYLKIDPNFGDEEDLIRLCERASEYDISVILDGVFSHVGSDSRYFNREGNYDERGAYQSVHSPYYSWFRFRHYPDDYESWWGIDTMPNVNEDDPSYRSFILDRESGVIAYWMDRGIRGWRLDVADELPDSFIKGIQHRVKEKNRSGIVIGEVWEDASNKISYEHQREYLYGDELDSVMNYPFQEGILCFIREEESGTTFLRKIQSIQENYPARIFDRLMNFLGTHDTLRSLNAMLFSQEPYEEKSRLLKRKLTEEEKKLARKRLQIAVMLLFSLPGTPCIYYGDEAGLEGWKDPFNRSTYPWGREDLEILALYRQWSNFYQTSSALRMGRFKGVNASERSISFLRASKDQILFCIVNLSNNVLQGTFPEKGKWQSVFTGEIQETEFLIPKDTAVVFSKSQG